MYTARRAGASLAFVTLAAIGLLVAITPAQAAVTLDDCTATLEQNGWGQSHAILACGADTDNEHRARADCTAAIDQYTHWIRANQTSASAYCTWGARGVIIETR